MCQAVYLKRPDSLSKKIQMMVIGKVGLNQNQTVRVRCRDRNNLDLKGHFTEIVLFLWFDP